MHMDMDMDLDMLHAPCTWAWTCYARVPVPRQVVDGNLLVQAGVDKVGRGRLLHHPGEVARVDMMEHDAHAIHAHAIRVAHAREMPYMPCMHTCTQEKSHEST